MKKKSIRNILIILGIIFLIFAGIIGYGLYSVYSFMSRIGTLDEKEIPAELKDARILTGAEFLRKTEMFKLDSDEFLKTLGKGSKIKDEKERDQYLDSQSARGIYGFDDIRVCGNEIVAVGKFGGFVFDLNGNLQREILFEPRERKISILGFENKSYRQTLDQLKIYDFNGDGRCEFFSNSSTDGVVVFDSEGKVTWRYGETDTDFWEDKSEAERDREDWITGAFAGDLNNDGTAEIIITRKKDGIRAFDIGHNEIWFQPDEYPTAEYKIFDTDGDGKNDILEFQGASSAIRNAATGEIIKKLKIESADDVLISKNEKNETTVRLFSIDENRMTITDLENKIIWTSDAPLSDVKNEKTNSPKNEPTPIVVGNIRIEPQQMSDDSERVYQPKAVRVKLKANQPDYIAVIGAFISIPRSDLYVYDEKGKLVYHELLPERAETIEVLKKANGNEEILVGGKNTIWRYAAN